MKLSKLIRNGITKNHWVIFSFVIVAALAFGVFKCNHKPSVSPEADICEVLYQIE